MDSRSEIDVTHLLQQEEARLRAQWEQGHLLSKFLARDAALWTNTDEDRWLGWLDSIALARAQLPIWEALSKDIQGIQRIVLLGMGGSSLGAEVLSAAYAGASKGPVLVVLDTTDADQIRAIEAAQSLETTIFVVASKSGSTMEPNLLADYFFERMKEKVGSERAGGHFIAITDPGSTLEARAKRDAFRAVIYGEPTIGGRFSVLSAFGFCPACLAGLPVREILDDAERMRERCLAVSLRDNPAWQLAARLYVAASSSHPFVCLSLGKMPAAFHAWIEQLLAESIGKKGKGILPLTPKAASYCENSRLLQESIPEFTDGKIVEEPTVGGELIRWMFATAMLGVMVQVNPFDQPDVEAAKVAAHEALESGQQSLSPIEGARQPLLLREMFSKARYLVILAYLSPTPSVAGELSRLQDALGRRFQVPVLVQYGPRYLHSTGQLFKGGFPGGGFLVITKAPALDLTIPRLPWTFGAIQRAQAKGDQDVLTQRGRAVLHVNLTSELSKEVSQLVDQLR